MANILEEFPGTGELPSDMNMSTLLAIIHQLSPEYRQQLLTEIDMGSEDELKQLMDSAMQPAVHVNPETVYMQYPEYRAQKLLRLYIPPILLLLGTFGNIFSFLILRNKTMTRQSTHHFLAALAIVDFLVLYVGLLRLWLGELTGFDPRDQAEWLCKTIVMLGYSCSDVSVWIIVAVTVERYIVVCHPLKANRLCNVTRAKRVILGLAALFITINLHFLWTAGFREDETGKATKRLRCDSSSGHEMLVTVIWPWVDALFYGFGPFVIISVLNILIIRSVVAATSGRLALQNRFPVQHSTSQHSCSHSNSHNSCSHSNGHSSCPHSSSSHQLLVSNNNTIMDSSNNNDNHCKLSSNGHSRATTPTLMTTTTTVFMPSSNGTTTSTHTRRLTSDSNLRLTVMLLTVSFAFLLTTLPMNVSVIGAAFWNRNSENIPRMVQVQLAGTIAELLMYLNHSVNFFLYCATGQKFRNEVVRMVCGKQRPNALLADHSQHIYCSRMCVASYMDVRRSTDETEL